jgi:hypothetical protein
MISEQRSGPLYRQRYLLLALSLFPIFGLIASGYLARSSTIDLSSGGMATGDITAVINTGPDMYR